MGARMTFCHLFPLQQHLLLQLHLSVRSIVFSGALLHAYKIATLRVFPGLFVEDIFDSCSACIQMSGPLMSLYSVVLVWFLLHR